MRCERRWNGQKLRRIFGQRVGRRQNGCDAERTRFTLCLMLRRWLLLLLLMIMLLLQLLLLRWVEVAGLARWFRWRTDDRIKMVSFFFFRYGRRSGRCNERPVMCAGGGSPRITGYHIVMTWWPEAAVSAGRMFRLCKHDDWKLTTKKKKD